MLTRRFFGRDIVLFRTATGRPAAVEAFCPHLGAHLGHGGTVRGEHLRCPFHGFLFETDGSCAATPCGPPPPAARLGLLDLREIGGTLLVFHDPGHAAPVWEVSGLEQLGQEWLPLRHKTFRFRGHPQEVIENSADIGHFGVLHGFRNIRELEPLRPDGPSLRARYAIQYGRFPFRGVDATFDLRIDGLGCTRVDLTASALGLQARSLVMTTPADPDHVELRLAVTMRRHERSGRLSSAVWIPADLLLQRALLRQLASEVRTDIAIWRRKCYLQRPALGMGDGPIGMVRKWAGQFYLDGVPAQLLPGSMR